MSGSTDERREREVDTLRVEAFELIEQSPSNLAWRSCWECNPAHEFLKEDRCVVWCVPSCGKYYYRGVDITEYPEVEDGLG